MHYEIVRVNPSVVHHSTNSGMGYTVQYHIELLRQVHQRHFVTSHKKVLPLPEGVHVADIVAEARGVPAPEGAAFADTVPAQTSVPQTERQPRLSIPDFHVVFIARRDGSAPRGCYTGAPGRGQCSPAARFG
ncbi:hypothetical protein EVAR_18022_1 [Eumeta japonica]|uniref:Uncharacterized protein n=1 Tax=Eumeta variegata TaxID=151549 RepID=A0A4C1ZRW9_EUMVA|nr:hypothetical protein EVAR_18022_1 [Eumeta japonica]